VLKHALQRCVTAAGLIGRRALIVNAVDAEAAAFRGRRGFIPSKDDPLVLFKSIADIAASLRWLGCSPITKQGLRNSGFRDVANLRRRAHATMLRTNSGSSCRWLRVIPSLGTTLRLRLRVA
jgi:hypothetical protein